MGTTTRNMFRTAFTPLRNSARLYSTAPLSAKNLSVTRTNNPKEKPHHSELVFGKSMSDHILEADWYAASGWNDPVIKPYSAFQMDPASLVLHYGLECFEGMKAYKDKKGQIRLFRPHDNMERMNRSAKRLSLPTYDVNVGVDLIKEFLKVEEDWIPTQRGCSYYLRPTMIATQAALGVQASNQAKWYVIGCPVGPYYKSGFKPVKLLADSKNVRAWPGGVGQYKVGGNYAPGIVPQREAAERGYAQILWLFGEKHNLTEVGTMNMFVYWKNAKGEKELVTAPLDGTILPGVTRSSVISLARSHGITVREGYIPIADLIEATKEDRVIECFGAGTACIIAPINGINYMDKDYDIPLDINDPSANAGPLAQKLSDEIQAIQYGEVEHEWSVIVD